MPGSRSAKKVLWACVRQEKVKGLIGNKHQMHALVFGLLQEGVDPTRITTLNRRDTSEHAERTVSGTYHETNTLEVAKSCCDHPGYAGDRLEE